MHWHLNREQQGGPKTWNHQLARCRIICVLQQDLLHQLSTWWFETVLQGLCFTYYLQQIVTAYGIYLLTVYIWMNYTFTSIYFQDFLCQSYRRNTRIFTFVSKHWVAADPLDRCKNPWCYTPKHKHFPDSLSLTLVYAMFHCWQWNCCTYTASTSGVTSITHKCRMQMCIHSLQLCWNAFS